MNRVVPLLTPINFKKREIIWDRKQWPSGIYFLVEGKVNLAIRAKRQKRFKLSSFNMSNFLNQSNLSQARKFLEDEKQDLENFLLEVKARKTLKESKTLRNKISKSSEIINFMTMTNGSYFGEIEIILRKRRTCMVIAATECDLFYLSRMVIFSINFVLGF